MKKILTIIALSLLVLMLAGCVTEKEPLDKRGEEGKPNLMKECFEKCMAEEDGAEDGCKRFCENRMDEERKPGLDDEKSPLIDGEKPPLRDGEKPPMREGEKPPLDDDDMPVKEVETDDDESEEKVIEDVSGLDDDEYEADLGDVI